MQTMSDIHPTAVVEPGAEIAEDVSIGPFCSVGPDVSIGSGTRLVSHVAVTGHTRIGTSNLIWSHVTLGGYPQDMGYEGEPTKLLIGDNNVLRESVTMHVGSVKGGGVTRVGNGNYLMVGVHIAHDCQLGDGIVMANNILLAGHVHVEDNVVMGGASAVHHFGTIGRCAFVAGMARVLHDIPPYMIAEGEPTRVRHANLVGLARNGFSHEQIKRLNAACRRLYRPKPAADGSTTTMDQNLARLEADCPDDEHVRYLIDFVRRSMSGPHGRYRESFR